MPPPPPQIGIPPMPMPGLSEPLPVDDIVWPQDLGDSVAVGTPNPPFEAAAVSSSFRTGPYRADTVLDGWSTSALTVRAASMRGHSHRYRGVPRQDDFALSLRGESLVVAIADGVSGAAQSHIGSSAAVRYAAQWLTESAAPVANTNWLDLVKNAAWNLNVQAATTLGLAAPDARETERLLATTLACAVLEPAPDGCLTAHVVSIGDSGCWVLSDAGYAPIFGGKQLDEAGLSSSAVTALPRVPADVRAISVLLGPNDVLVMATDGVADPLGSGRGLVGGLFQERLVGRVPSLPELALLLDFSRETFDDDRTLVAVWPRQALSG